MGFLVAVSALVKELTPWLVMIDSVMLLATVVGWERQKVKVHVVTTSQHVKVQTRHT